jgi:hypothetical protein
MNEAVFAGASTAGAQNRYNEHPLPQNIGENRSQTLATPLSYHQLIATTHELMKFLRPVERKVALAPGIYLLLWWFEIGYGCSHTRLAMGLCQYRTRGRFVIPG